MQPLSVIFIGPQGSGKGTQISNLLADLKTHDENKKVVDIQTGRGFRNMLERGETFADKKIAQTLFSGQLQPDFLTNLIWGQEMMEQLDNTAHLLIDGFPRTVAQAKVLDEALDFFERVNLQIINLDTPEAVVQERMKARGRADDTDEAIEHRLAQYRRDTVPVLDFYHQRDNTTIHNIDGTRSIGEVHEAIVTALNIPNHDN